MTTNANIELDPVQKMEGPHGLEVECKWEVHLNSKLKKKEIDMEPKVAFDSDEGKGIFKVEMYWHELEEWVCVRKAYSFLNANCIVRVYRHDSCIPIRIFDEILRITYDENGQMKDDDYMEDNPHWPIKEGKSKPGVFFSYK